MAIDWKNNINGGSACIGVEWNLSESATGVSYMPYVYLYVTSRSQDSSMPYTWSLSAGGTVVTSGSTTLSYNAQSKANTLLDTFANRSLAKTSSAQTLSLTCSFSDGYVYGESKINTTLTWTVNVAALASYTVSYSANGGSGAPGSQTNYYGTATTISSTKPTKTGYTFLGWATSSSGGVAYASGATYSAYSSITLYAVWQVITYTITYNANNGQNAPANQTKTYGTDLTLSSLAPTRAGYIFQGWATSSSATTATYSAGGTYTANAAATLYAVWKVAYNPPRITNLVVTRCTSAKAASESGTYATVSFSWATDKAASKYILKYQKTTETTITTATTVTISGTSGSVSSVLIGGGNLNADYDYKIYVAVYDADGNAETYATITGQKYAIDFLPDNAGAAFGKAATTSNLLDSAWPLKVAGAVTATGAISSGSTITASSTIKGSTVNATSGFQVNGTAVNDFVLASNISTATASWSYIKWKNGNAVAWTTFNVPYGNANILAYSPWFPFTFDTSYTVTATINDYGGNSAASLPRTVKVGKTSNSRIYISVQSSAGGFTSSTTLPVSIQIMGKWTQ